MVANVCEQIAKTFQTVVYHHWTFTFGIDKSETKNIILIHKLFIHLVYTDKTSR